MDVLRSTGSNSYRSLSDIVWYWHLSTPLATESERWLDPCSICTKCWTYTRVITYIPWVRCLICTFHFWVPCSRKMTSSRTCNESYSRYREKASMLMIEDLLQSPTWDTVLSSLIHKARYLGSMSWVTCCPRLINTQAFSISCLEGQNLGDASWKC